MKKKCVSLKDKLQTRNIPDTGTWVQCCHSDCKKWRYLPDMQDPTDVPDYWICSHNPDERYNSCDKPEEEYDESEHILTKYTEGSVVWARMSGYPWWPAMIEIDPDSGDYFELQHEASMHPRGYHVVFFDDKVSRAWISASSLKPFSEMDLNNKRQFIIKGQNYYKAVSRAAELAEQALTLSIKERLLKFSFSKRYNGRWGKSMEYSVSEDGLFKDAASIEPEPDMLEEVDHWNGSEDSSQADVKSVDHDYPLEEAELVQVKEVTEGLQNVEKTSHAAKSDMQAKTMKKRHQLSETHDSDTVTTANVTQENDENKVESDQLQFSVEKVKKKKKKKQLSNEKDVEKKKKSKPWKAMAHEKCAENESTADGSLFISVQREHMERNAPIATCLAVPVLVPQKMKKFKDVEGDHFGQDPTTTPKTSSQSKPKENTNQKRRAEDMETLGECSPLKKKKKKAEKERALKISCNVPESAGKSDSPCVSASGEPEKETNGDHGVIFSTSQVPPKKKKKSTKHDKKHEKETNGDHGVIFSTSQVPPKKKKKSTKHDRQKSETTVNSEMPPNKKEKVTKPEKKLNSEESSNVPSKIKDLLAKADGQKIATNGSSDTPSKKKKKTKPNVTKTETSVAGEAPTKQMVSAASDVQRPAKPGNAFAPKFVPMKKVAKPFHIKPKLGESKPASVELAVQTKMGKMPEKTEDGTKKAPPEDVPLGKFKPFKFKRRTALAKSPVLGSEPSSPESQDGKSSIGASETLSITSKQVMGPEGKENKLSLQTKKEKSSKNKSSIEKHRDECKNLSTYRVKKSPAVSSSKMSSSPVVIDWEELSQELHLEQVVPREESSSEELDSDQELNGHSEISAQVKGRVSTRHHCGKSTAEIVDATGKQLNDGYSSDSDLELSAFIIEESEISVPEIGCSDSDPLEFAE